MMPYRRNGRNGGGWFVTLLLLLLLPQGAAAENASGDPILQALADEVERAMAALSESEPAPYFIGVELTEQQSVQIGGESGGLHGYSPSLRRWLDVDLRIGSRTLDSSHALRTGSERSSRRSASVVLSDDPALIRHALWLEINERYARARDRWAKVEAESKVLVEEEPAEDLVEVEPARVLGETRQLRYDAAVWERRAKEASRALAEHPVVVQGGAGFSGDVENRWFVSSEGTRVRHSTSIYRFDLNAGAVADDGERLGLFYAFDSHRAEDLPGGDVIVTQARELTEMLAALRDAPLEEPYTGPAILSDRASAVFFHEIFGHRVEGHRLKQVENAQTFRNRVGERILPEFLSVHDDPTRVRAAGADLRGYYRFDNQGVPAERVALVESGVLRGFLQSRSPVSRGDRANGHARRSQGNDAVSRQANLIVTASERVENAELRRELVELAKQAGKEYALYIDEIQGGFTFTGRTIPNAFNVNATRTHRVYVDGRPDELVRGVDLIGTPLEAFSKIIRAGTVERVFNGSCGAESGWVPVAAVAPSLLLQSIETQRKRKDQVTPPLLPPPLAEPSKIPGEEVR